MNSAQLSLAQKVEVIDLKEQATKKTLILFLGGEERIRPITFMDTWDIE